MSIANLVTAKNNLVDLEQLSFERNVLSLSTSGGSIDRIVTVKFPKFVEAVNAFYDNLVKPKAIVSSAKEESVVKNLRKRNVQYSDLKQFTMFCPPGMKVDFITFTNGLNSIVENVANIEKDLLETYNTFIGSLINDRSRFETKRVNEHYTKIKLLDIEKLKKDLQKIVSKNEVSTVPYVKAVPNHSAWTDVVKVTNVMAETLNKNSVERVYKALEDSKELIATLSKIFDDVDLREEYEGIHATKFNKKLFAQIGDLTYNVAEAIEFYTVIVYLVESTAVAVNDNVAKINKTLLR